MSKLARLQARLARCDARIAELEESYPILSQYQSYSQGFGEITTTYQNFNSIAREYQRKLDEKDALEDRIEELQGVDSSNVRVALFQRTL